MGKASLEKLLFPLNFNSLYPGVYGKADILQLFTDDLNRLCEELAEIDGIEGAGGEVYFTPLPTGKWRVYGEIKIIGTFKSSEAELVLNELLAEGFMYKAQTNTWIGAGIL